MLFHDRRDAGRQLAGRLPAFRGPDIVIAGLVGGGAAVAEAVADHLHVQFDVLVVHSLMPDRAERPIGAIADRDVCVVEHDPDSDAAELHHTERRERDALRRRDERFRRVRPRPRLADCTVVVVDEAVSDPAPVRAACRAAYAHGAIRVVVAAPIATDRAVYALGADADKVICLHVHEYLGELGGYYRDHRPVTDDDVCALLLGAPLPRADTCAEQLRTLV